MENLKWENLIKLQRQVLKEYEQWYEHIKGERDRKSKILEKLLPTDIPWWQVRINLLWKNLQLERALFVSDKLNVKILCNDWIIWRNIMKNAWMVTEFDDMDMDLIEFREDIVDFNALYWLAITVIDWYDEENEQPISSVINPLYAIPDPKNWRGSKMRFFGYERRVSKDFLESADGFDENAVKKIIDTDTNEEQKKIQQAENDANNTIFINEQEGLIDVYDHYTSFDWKKILTTWANNRNLLIRYVEIESLSNAEKRTPNKLVFPVQLHRRKNKPFSFFGVALADEVLQYQDAISQLTNLQLIQARISALWPDVFIDSNLWIDIETISSKTPWWRVIQVGNVWTWSIWNSFYQQDFGTPSPLADNMIWFLKWESKEWTWAWDIVFGNSPQWSNTKAEIQTLMANSNQLLGAIWDNYMRWQRDYWLAHYRAYALYMEEKSKKVITLFQKWNTLSLELEKNDFIADWKVQVYIESQNQIDKENERNSAKLLALQWVYLQFIQWNYARNEFLRKIWDWQGIKWFDSTLFIEESADEMIAKQNLELLNRDEEVSSPMPWEDFRTYLAIYKQALDTEAKQKAVFEYEQAIILTWQGQWEWQATWWDEQVKNIAMNQLSQQQNGINTPNLSQISM